jgi:flagella basal body P-ring formation protein FlgA
MQALSLLPMMLVLVMPAAKPVPLPATVVVRAMPQVAGSTFRLGEIADITGEDRSLVRQLTEVEVGTAPLPGLTRPLYPSDIVIRLRYRGIDPKRVDLQCPPSIRILRVAGEVPGDAVTDAAKAALVASQGTAADDLIIEALPTTAKLLVSPGKLEYRAGAPRGRVESGTMTVPVTILVEGAPAKNVDVPFRIKRAVTAVVAMRDLEVGSVIRAEDVTVAKIETPAGGTTLIDPQLVIGRKTTRRIAQGAPLSDAVTGTVKIVANGARLVVVSAVGGVSISVPGTARSAGGVGERVRVYIEETKKELSGVVVDAATVRLEDR